MISLHKSRKYLRLSLTSSASEITHLLGCKMLFSKMSTLWSRLYTGPFFGGGGGERASEISGLGEKRAGAGGVGNDDGEGGPGG